MSDKGTIRKGLIRILATGGIVLAASGFVIRPSNAEMSQAQIMGALYGTLMGHLDICGLKVQRWHVEAMGRQISKLASNDDDRELAIALFRSMAAEAHKSPSMTCNEVRASLRQSEKELR